MIPRIRPNPLVRAIVQLYFLRFWPFVEVPMYLWQSVLNIMCLLSILKTPPHLLLEIVGCSCPQYFLPGVVDLLSNLASRS